MTHLYPSPAPTPPHPRAPPRLLQAPVLRDGIEGERIEPGPSAGPPAPLNPEDWDARFREQMQRLRLAVADALDSRAGSPVRDRLGGVQSRVLDCVDQLEQLQGLLAQERSDRRRLSRAFSQARDGERRALHLAHHDALTALPNRAFFIDHLARALAPGARGPGILGVIYIDLDRLKAVNDTHGHALGDEVLRVSAQRMREALRAQDLVCRLGGDEFGCLPEGAASRDDLTRLAGKLFDAVSRPIRIAGLDLVVTPSIGIAMCPQDGVDVGHLLHAADRAMYRAKRERCGHAFFDEEVDR